MYLLQILQIRNDPEHLKPTLFLPADTTSLCTRVWVCVYKSLDLTPLVSKFYGTFLSSHPSVPPNLLQIGEYDSDRQS